MCANFSCFKNLCKNAKKSLKTVISNSEKLTHPTAQLHMVPCVGARAAADLAARFYAADPGVCRRPSSHPPGRPTLRLLPQGCGPGID